MPQGEPDIAYCHACGSPMDVSELEPFTNVECPGCSKHTRVKREFGPYTLLRRHAIGGMSMVFVAQDNTLEREVVLKILSEEYSADEKRIAAFEEEARITASIGHPHVVRVFTTGRAFGRFFIAMEFVPGGHYEGHIREQGSIPEAEALPLMIQVVEGLSAAHQAGLIHRDIKPGNILIDGHGKAKIVDFGLALITQGGVAQAEEIWATPYYVPPETIEGLPEDFRSDVYAFGSTFYHALSGKPPCDEESMDTNRLRKAKRNIMPLEAVASWLSPATCAVIDRCMAHDSKKRFDSYEELIAALKSAQSQLGSVGSAPGVAERRKRGGSGSAEKLGLAFAGLLVLVAAGFAWKWIKEGNEEAAVIIDEAPEVLVSPDPVPSTDGGAGLRVASAYREASEALAMGRYERAREMFGEVRDDPDVMEPTGSWAACEAVAASYLDGRSEQAREDAKLALEHVRSAKDLPPGIPKILENVLGRLPRAKPIEAPASFENGVGPRYLSWLLSGLKNWEQGMPENALPFFIALVEAPTTGNNAWLAPYAKIATDYISDYERLSKIEPESFDLVQLEYQALNDELHALRATLRTKGRARFNVRVWQEELKKRASQSTVPVVPTLAVDQQTVEGFPASIDEDLAACRFDEASNKLKSWEPVGDEEELRREAMLTLAEAATTFLAELCERAAGREGVELLGRDGRRFEGIAGGDGSEVQLQVSASDRESVAWAEIEPESLINLHRELSRSESSEIEKLRRHEEAIAFDLLAGDPERGREAAERLAEASEVFNRRWMKLQPALKR
ncbi:serine/threonine protein kinase [Haloferula sp.]|uniref:serine/threonine protein kinase n=1 Tax=Haloferula sp. TaxID=2497595 RepID=UPI003C714977